MTDKITFMKAVIRKKRFFSKPVPIVPFFNWDYYYTTETLEWRAEGSAAQRHKGVKVPKGFVTDLASIPRAFYSLMTPTGPYAYPAIVHDYLYWFQTGDRDDADDILRLAMEDLRVPAAKITAIYEAASLGGNSAWSSNKAARKAGEKRILKKYPESMITTWDEWKAAPNVFDDTQV